MTRTALSSIAAIALTVAACDAPTRAVAPADRPQLDAATTFNTQFKVDFSFPITDPCDPAHEVIDVTGTIHMHFHFTGNDNELVLFSDQNDQGLHGVGETTGNQYEFILIEHQLAFTVSENGATTTRSHETFNVVSQGSGDNFVAHINMHVTINANGEETAVVDNAFAECTG